MLKVSLPSLTSVEDDEDDEVDEGKGERWLINWLLGVVLDFGVPEIKI